MLEELIKKIEDKIDSDDFEMVQEECVEEIERADLGLSAVEPLLKLMERHPLADFGVPGGLFILLRDFINKDMRIFFFNLLKILLQYIRCGCLIEYAMIKIVMISIGNFLQKRRSVVTLILLL